MLFVGDDWAEDHHDVEVQDEDGAAVGQGPAAGGHGRDDPAARADRRASRRRRRDPETGRRERGGRDRDRPGPVGGGAGRGRLSGVRDQPDAGGPLPGTALDSGAKCDAGDAHVLADIVRPTAPISGRSPGTAPTAEGQAGRPHAPDAGSGTAPGTCCGCVSALREFFPAALEAFDDLTAPDALELLERAPDPGRAARLTRSKITAALERARRRDPAPRPTRSRRCCGRRRCASPR